MAYSITDLPLYTDPYYRYSISLEGQQRYFNFYWNEREGHWHFDVFNAGNVPILLGQKIVESHPIAGDYDLSQSNLSGYFIALPNNQAVMLDTNDLTTLPTLYKFFYIYQVE